MVDLHGHPCEDWNECDRTMRTVLNMSVCTCSAEVRGKLGVVFDMGGGGWG